MAKFKIELRLGKDPSGHPCVDAHGDFERNMNVGDEAEFSTPDHPSMRWIVEFEPVLVNPDGSPVKRKDGSVAKPEVPFGDDLSPVKRLEAVGPRTLKVMRSCRSMMSSTVFLPPDQKEILCPVNPDPKNTRGTTVCTGGGMNPVVCH